LPAADRVNQEPLGLAPVASACLRWRRLRCADISQCHGGWPQGLAQGHRHKPPLSSTHLCKCHPPPADVGFFWEAPAKLAPHVPWAVTANMAVRNTDVRFREGFPRTGECWVGSSKVGAMAQARPTAMDGCFRCGWSMAHHPRRFPGQRMTHHGCMMQLSRERVFRRREVVVTARQDAKWGCACNQAQPALTVIYIFAGGGEDVDFCLQLGARLLAVPQATAEHPWWPDRRPKVRLRCFTPTAHHPRRTTHH